MFAHPSASTSSAYLRERAADACRSATHAAPTVLGRAVQRTALLACLAVVLYGTLGPLSRHSPWIDLSRPSTAALPWADSDANDLLTNLIVYVPVGVVLRLLGRRRGFAGWPDFLLAIAGAAAMSYLTELLQQWMPARQSSLVDVIVNTAGAAVGAAVAVRVQKIARRIHAALFYRVPLSPSGWGAMSVAALVLIGAGMTVPWRVHAPIEAVGWVEALSIRDKLWLPRALLFGALGFIGANRLIARGLERRRCVARAALTVAALACMLEASQRFLTMHIPSVGHAVTASVAGLLGALLAGLLAERPESADAAVVADDRLERRRQLVLVCALALLAAAPLAILIYSACANGLRQSPEFCWTPFVSQFHRSFTSAVSDLLNSALWYGLVTLLAIVVNPTRGPAAALALMLVLASLYETGRAYVIGPPGDITMVVVAAGAGLAAMHASRFVRGWRLFRGTDVATAAWTTT